MKIAVLGARGFPNVQGGIESHCENLYPHIADRGCEVIVFTRRPYVDRTNYIYKGVKLVSLPCPKNRFLECIFHTILGLFAARKISPDILHIHAIGPSLVVPLARILGLKVVMTNHGPDYERKKWGNMAKLVLVLGEYLGSIFSNAIICVSKFIGDNIKRKYNKDVAVIPNGVAPAQVSKNDNAIKKYGLSRGRYALAVGRFVPEKGFHDLIDAFDNIEGLKLVIAGRADHPDRYSVGLKEKAEKNKNIVLTGFLTGEALRQLYSHAGLFVLPSYYEGLPIVLLEAMSYGLSCIASDIRGNKDVGLGDDRFFKAGDVRALAAKIKEFIKRPVEQEEKIAQMNMVAEKHNWDKITDMTFDVYQQVLNT